MKDVAGARTLERANRREATGPKGEGRDSPSTFPQYPEYKDSGVEWIGKVPAHWVVGPLRWYATIQGGVAKGKSYSNDTPTVDLPYLRVANVQDGHVDLSSVNTVTVALSEVDRYRLQPGDVLMNEGGDNDKLGRGTVWEGEIADCLHQNHVFAIRPNQYLLPYWLSMFTRSGAARSYFYLYSKQSTNLASISSSNVMSCPLPLPPQEEQRHVLSFLDHETARVDALVEEQQRLIQLLKEKRQAVISHAVTKGLDPDVPMKDSGVEWLGEVPAHWEVTRLKRCSSRVVVGIAEAATHAYVDSGGIPILRATNVRPGKLIGNLLYLSEQYASERGGKRINAGDLVTVRTGNAGVTAVVPEELDGCQCFTMLITTLKNCCHPDFFEHFLNTPYCQSYFSIQGWGTAQVNISVPILQETPVLNPPSQEQGEIVKNLSKRTKEIDALIGSSQKLEKLLKERRSALISAAVTGKIDVRGWQPPSGSAASSDATQTEVV